jgi:hypothetical protein
MIIRSYESNDARTLDKSAKKAIVEPVAVVAQAAPVAQPEESGGFHPGDIVSIRTNTLGTVLAVNGNGVQVDFGLGAGWFTRKSLTLVKAVAVPE